MLSKEEIKQRKQAFWNALKESMAQNKTADKKRNNWMNYRTGVKNMRINFFADENEAAVNLDFEHKDSGIRELQIEQLEECRKVLENTFAPMILEWHLHFVRENGKVISRVRTTPLPSNILNEAEWPKTIDYLKEGMLKMDAFWCDFGAIFEDLQ